MHLRAVGGWALVFILAIVPILAAERTQVPADFRLQAMAGSRASWGEDRILLIDSLGAVRFYRIDLGSGRRDLLTAVLSPEARQALYDTIEAAGFFSLDTLYTSDRLDGSGISLSVTAAGRQHGVGAENIAVPPVDRIARTLNTILQPYGMRLSYGALSDTLLKAGGR